MSVWRQEGSHRSSIIFRHDDCFRNTSQVLESLVVHRYFLLLFEMKAFWSDWKHCLTIYKKKVWHVNTASAQTQHKNSRVCFCSTSLSFFQDPRLRKCISGATCWNFYLIGKCDKQKQHVHRIEAGLECKTVCELVQLKLTRFYIYIFWRWVIQELMLSAWNSMALKNHLFICKFLQQ